VAKEVDDLAEEAELGTAPTDPDGKALVRELRTLDGVEAKRHTVRHIAQQRTSAEGQEGLTAFLEKRPARWND